MITLIFFLILGILLSIKATREIVLGLAMMAFGLMIIFLRILWGLMWLIIPVLLIYALWHFGHKYW